MKDRESTGASQPKAVACVGELLWVLWMPMGCFPREKLWGRVSNSHKKVSGNAEKGFRDIQKDSVFSLH